MIKKITIETIEKSFKVTGISIKLDGTENHLVKKNEEFSDEIIEPDNLINEEEYFDLENFNKKEDNKKTQISDQTKITKYFSQIDSNDMDIDD